MSGLIGVDCIFGAAVAMILVADRESELVYGTCNGAVHSVRRSRRTQRRVDSKDGSGVHHNQPRGAQSSGPRFRLPGRRLAFALPARDRQVIAILLVAAFVVIFNETIMSVALPRLMVDLDLSARTVQWLTTAFMLTMAVVIPTTGFLLQRISTRTVFMLAMGLFSAGTLLAAVSPGFWLLLLARIVQASGTAVMIPLLMTTVLTLVPVERRGVVMGNITIAISVAPAIGPTLSGLVLQFLSWRFMFVLVLPIALASLVYGSRRLVNIGQAGHQKLDLPSVLLSIPAFGGVVYGLSQLGRGASGAAVALGFIGFGLVCMLIFGWRQLRLARSGRSPLLDLRAFSYRHVQPEPCAVMSGDAGAVRHGDLAADLSADGSWHRRACHWADAVTGRAADGPGRTDRRQDH